MRALITRNRRKLQMSSANKSAQLTLPFDRDSTAAALASPEQSRLDRFAARITAKTGIALASARWHIQAHLTALGAL